MKQPTTFRFSYAIILTASLMFALWPLTNLQAQEDCFPANTNRLVSDFEQILSAEQTNALESKLNAFAKETSTQIAVVIVKDLCGYDKAMYSYTLAEKWGIGQQGKNNGILIMLKPLGGTGERHTYIAVGYGLEGVVPDAISKRIVEQEMIPFFKTNDFYGGLDAATNVLISLTKGEYTAEQYSAGNPAAGIGVFLIILMILGLVMLSRAKEARSYARNNNLGFWAALALLNAAASSRRGSYGNFSSGGFGGGGGGFGGFGGGSFGGGGAGGSW
jgi:uncharacterized protein